MEPTTSTIRNEIQDIVTKTTCMIDENNGIESIRWIAIGCLVLSTLLLFVCVAIRGRDRQVSKNSEETTTFHKKVQARLNTKEGAFAMCVGRTPLVKIQCLSKLTGCTILGKAEFLNPGGSTKDRIAREIVLDAEARGDLRPGGTVVEGTSGSTGISLALMARSHGYDCEIVMPDDVSKGKSDLLEAFGARVRRVKSASIVNDENYVTSARKLAETIDGAYFCDQFENPSNFKAHYRTTGPEIWSQTDGRVDAFVMGAGTGGTISGVAAYLKERRPQTQVVLIDPPGSALANRVNYGVLYTEEQAERTIRRHRYETIIEGVGLSRLTANLRRGLDMGVIDSAVRCTDQEAVSMSRYLLRHEGLYLGSSSAMNCAGAVKVAKELGPGHVIVTLLCDGGNRHRERFWSDAYVRGQGIDPDLKYTPSVFEAKEGDDGD